jgi:hypothetical protein
MEKKYKVRMSQEVFWDVEVVAADELTAMERAYNHTIDGERVPKDEDIERGDFSAMSAEEI